jgi:hypothetical protein
MYDDDTSTADTNALSAATANLYRLILSHLEDVAELSGETSILLGRLQHYISQLESSTLSEQTLKIYSSSERVGLFVEESDRYLEEVLADHEDLGAEQVLGDDRYQRDLTSLGEKVDRLRDSVFVEIPTSNADDESGVNTTTALSSIRKSLHREGCDSIVVTGLHKLSITERLKHRKRRIKWLRTGSGRRYLRAQEIRHRMKKRKDPKRVRLGRKVAQLYSND